jgi:hypothetical protein
VIDQHGVMQYTDMPPLASGRDSAPAMALNIAAQPGMISPSN